MTLTAIGSGETPPRNSIARFATALIFVPFLIQAIRYLYLSFRCLTARNDVAYPEFANVFIFLNSAHTGKIYADPLHMPLDPEIYGPAFYIVGAAIAKFTHADPQKTAEAARFIAFITLFVTAACVGLICRKLEKTSRWTVIAVILAFTCAWGMPLYSSVRADATAVCIGYVAFTVYVLRRGSLKAAFFAGALASLAILTKQTLLCVALVLVLDSLLAKDFRATAALILGMIPLPILVFGGLILRKENFLSSMVINGHGQLLWNSCIPTVINSIRGNENSLLVMGFAAIGIYSAINDRRYQPIVLLCVFSWVMGVAALSNVGAASNYLMLPWFALLPLVPRGLEKFEGWASRSTAITVPLILLSAFLIYHQRDMWLSDPPKDLDTTAVAGHKMLSDVPYLETYSAEPQMLDPFLMANLNSTNHWDPSIVAGKVDREEYDLLVYEAGPEKNGDPHMFLTNIYRGVPYMAPMLVDHVNQHYSIHCAWKGYALFVPKNRTPSLDWNAVDRVFDKPCVSASGVLTTHSSKQQ